MDDQKVGSALRALRQRRRLRQADVGARAGVSQATVSRIERGHLGTFSIAAVRAVAAALDARIDLTPRWRGGELDRLLDARHAAVVGAVSRQVIAAGWVANPEVSFSIYGERGSIDLLAWHAPSRTILLIEAKTEIVDLQDTLRSVDRKRRLAPRIAAERGWRAGALVGVWVVLPDGRTNRRRLAAHRTLLRSAFPADGRMLGAWLRKPIGGMAALTFLPAMHSQSAKRQLRAVTRVSRPHLGRHEHRSGPTSDK
jgi:transcriptional regulator with XRE-family HTH domain